MDLATLTLCDYAAGFNSKSGLTGPSNRERVASNGIVLRRCRTREQGTALLTVGHAIEYLVDSRLIKQGNTTEGEREALSILIQANLTVYNEGTEIKQLLTRLRQWFRGGSMPKHEAANAQI